MQDQLYALLSDFQEEVRIPCCNTYNYQMLAYLRRLGDAESAIVRCVTYPFRLKNVHIRQLIQFHANERELGKELAFISKASCLKGFRTGKAKISVREFGIVAVVGLDQVLSTSYYGIKSIEVNNDTITMMITKVINDGLIEGVPVIFDTPQIKKLKLQ